MSSAAARARRRRAREKYKPKPIRCLVIAEAPPSDLRYFYFENVPEYDWLFRGIMRVLFLGDFAGYSRQPEHKRELLSLFQAKGYWLLDAIEDPMDNAPKGSARIRYVLANSNLLRRLKQLSGATDINRKTPIILIKATVYDALHDLISAAGYNVVDKKIPFPSSGQQTCFEMLFHEALVDEGLIQR